MEALWTFMEDMITFKCLFEGNGVMILKNYSHKLVYAGAVARETLGCQSEKLDIKVSGNIIKNVKSVIVPNTGGMRGIEAALCAGVIAGDAQALLEVIAGVTPG